MTPRRLVIITVGLLAAATIGLRAVRPQSDPLDPVVVAADTHKLAFENTFLRVLDVRVPPGKVEPRHRHPHGLSVYFTDWEAEVRVDGKPAEVRPRKAGTFAWSEAVVHTIRNAGKTEGRILRVELKF